MDFSNIAVGGVALIPVVLGLVQVIKGAGVSGQKLTYVAMAIGMIAGLLYKISIMFPVTSQWIELIVYVSAFGLSALSTTGLYDLGKAWITSIAGPKNGQPN